MLHVWDKEQDHTGFRWGDSRERLHLENLDVDGREILKRIFRKLEEVMD